MPNIQKKSLRKLDYINKHYSQSYVNICVVLPYLDIKLKTTRFSMEVFNCILMQKSSLSKKISDLMTEVLLLKYILRI